MAQTQIPNSPKPMMLTWKLEPSTDSVPANSLKDVTDDVKEFNTDSGKPFPVEAELQMTVHFLLPIERNLPSAVSYQLAHLAILCLAVLQSEYTALCISSIYMEFPRGQQRQIAREIDTLIAKAMESSPENVEAILLDRLHYMETLHTIASDDKRRRVARETLDKFTMVAAKAGMHQLKDQLEDLAFHQLNPEARAQILIRLNSYHLEKQNIVSLILEELQDILAENNLRDFYMLGREKTPFSIWQKMERKCLKFEQIRDIIAFRVILKTVPDCYLAIDILHKAFMTVPGRFKDYICWGKYQNYGALHTSIIGPFEKTIEVQVKTEEMNALAMEVYMNYWRQKSSFY